MGTLFNIGYRIIASNEVLYRTPIPVNFKAGYSFSYLTPSFYGNPVIKVKRSSDNNSRNFAPIEITNGDLEQWVGSGNNGIITHWYNQSPEGSLYDLVDDADDSAEPKIVINGVLRTQNGKPSAYFDGNDDGLKNTNLDSAFNGNNILQAYTVGTANSNGAFWSFSKENTATFYRFLRLDSTNRVRFIEYNNSTTGQVNSVNDVTGTQQLYTVEGNINNRSMYVNGNLIGTQSTTVGGFSGISVFGIGGVYQVDRFDFNLLGDIQEIIFYNNDVSSQRTSIESNIINYYDIT